MKLPVNIKRKQANLPAYTIVSLIMLCIALFCLFIPFIPVFSDAVNKNMQTWYMILGGVGTMFFAFVTSYTVFNIVSPSIGVTISNEGIYEYTVAECGAGFIPKEAIVSLKTFGKDKKQYLGIVIDPEYVESLGEGIAAKREIRNNIEAGVPAVIIKQSDVYIPVSELFKLIKNAYETAEKPKNTEEKPVVKTTSESNDILQEDEEKRERFEKSFALLFNESNESKAKNADTDGFDLLTALNKKEDAGENTDAPPEEKQTINTAKLPPPPNVIRTVDELLAQLNIPSSPRKNDDNDEQ